MALIDMLRVCGTSNLPGTKTTLYYAPKGEFTGWPATKADNLGTDPGDTKILDEPFDFTGAPAGSGYWRRADILIDTGAVNHVLEGELGGRGYKNSLPFFILGTDAEQLEFADELVRYDGCLIAMIEDRNGKMRVLGTTGVPAQVESAEGGTGLKTGDRRGIAYVLMDSTGATSPIYDHDTHGIEITPNI